MGAKGEGVLGILSDEKRGTVAHNHLLEVHQKRFE
jgi:hypothetical protein